MSFTDNLRVALRTSDVKFNQNLPSYTWGETFWQTGFISPLSVWPVCGLCKWCTKVVIHSWQQHQISSDGCYQNYSHITAHSICWRWLLLHSSIQRNLYYNKVEKFALCTVINMKKLYHVLCWFCAARIRKCWIFYNISDTTDRSDIDIEWALMSALSSVCIKAAGTCKLCVSWDSFFW